MQINEDSTSHSVSLRSILTLSACPRQTSWAISILTTNLIFCFSKINLYIFCSHVRTYSWAISIQTLFWHPFSLRSILILSSHTLFHLQVIQPQYFLRVSNSSPQCVLHVRPSFILQLIAPSNTASAAPHSVIISIPAFPHSTLHSRTLSIRHWLSVFQVGTKRLVNLSKHCL